VDIKATVITSASAIKVFFMRISSDLKINEVETNKAIVVPQSKTQNK